jgi:hypothetical protein
MHPLVRDLYKRFVILGKDYPGGWSKTLRAKVKDGFTKNTDLKSELEIKRAVARGRYMTRELVGVIQLKKYRSMKSRYNGDES